ncbi:MAG: hypothetical protein WBA44_12860 [Mesorhizobium sp.]
MARIEQLAFAIAALAQRFAAPFGALFLAVYILAVGAVSWVAPGSNWDMIAYAGTVFEQRTSDPVEIHTQAYAAVKERVDAGDYVVLTSDRPYRIAQAESASNFNTMLAFYRVKVVYVELASWLSSFMQPVDALRAISTVSFFAIGLMTLIWAADRRVLAYGPIIVALLVFCGLGDTARIVTPDLLAGLFIIGSILLFARGNDAPSAVLMVAGCLIRPDNLALSATLLLAAIVIRRGFVAQAIGFAVALIGGAWMAQSAGHPGWWVQMWFSYVEFVPTLAGFDPPFSIVTYAQIVVKVVVQSLTNETWLAMVILQVGAAAVMLARGWRPQPRVAAALVALFLCELGKLFVAPQAETRTHLGYTIAGGLLLVEAIAFFAASRAGQMATDTSRRFNAAVGRAAA